MIRTSLAERAILGLARIVAGPVRRQWLDAVEAELSVLTENRLDWTLGSLVAAVKDRAARDWPLGAALLVLPTLALASTPLLFLIASALREWTGLSMLQLMPILAVAPFPFAVLLGAFRPRASVVAKCLAGFAVYQAIPGIGFAILFGQFIVFRWEANLSAYGLTPPLGLLITFVLWGAGTWLGSRWARTRMTVL